MKQFLIKLLIFSLLISIIDFSWGTFLGYKFPIPQLWFIFIFFVVTTAVFHIITINASKGKPQGFVRAYMGITLLKMGLCVGVIIAYRFIDKPTIIPFALAFLAHYFLFTIFEVPSLLKELKK
jgi:hypothetical protein